jgi:hypothetical protein
MEVGGAGDTYVKKGQKFLNDLENSLGRISESACAGLPLLRELENFRNRQKKRFERTIKKGGGS